MVSVVLESRNLLLILFASYTTLVLMLMIGHIHYGIPYAYNKWETDTYRNGYLWIFDESDGEKIFLYNKVLVSKHTFNHTRIDHFRNDFISAVGRNFNTYMSLDQHNSPIGTELSFNGKRKDHTFEVTEDIFKRLPQNTTYGTIPRCSVVGNSGLILNSHCGKCIDQADFVYRCNAAPIAGFAGDAGAKTNFTTFNPSIFRTRYGSLSTDENMANFLKDARQYRGQLWMPCLTYRVHAESCIHALENYNITENVLVLGHPEHFVQVEDFWKSRGLKQRPSSGFYLTSVALSHCREVHLFGFWPFSQTIDSDSLRKTAYHYFDDLVYDFKANKLSHKMDMEFSFLIQLHLLGIIKLHVDDCKPSRQNVE